MRYTGIVLASAAMISGYMEDEVLTFWELLTTCIAPPVVDGLFGVWHRREERRTAYGTAWLERKTEDGD